jgi:hypothetical protein
MYSQRANGLADSEHAPCVFCDGCPCFIYISQQNSEAGGERERVIMKMQRFATLDKASRDIGNIRGLNLAVVKHTTVQVTRLLL